jgi:hypothetical protein
LNGPFGLASGKSHLLYRYNGEPRRIRPWKDFPIDVLGDNGYAIAAPSELEKGSYEIIHGQFDDLDLLKPMRDGIILGYPIPRAIGRHLRKAHAITASGGTV